MKSTIIDIWYRLISSLWFLPALMVVLAIGLWYGMSQLDGYLSERSFSFGWVFSSGVEGTRSILTTIAGSIITVAGVVFSITIVVLSQSAGQFGPQLVKNFMQDKSTQITLGIFSATFVYSLLALSSVRGGDEPSPSQAATVMALILALASIGFLIQFIHNMARSVQSNKTIAAVVKEMDISIDRVFPAGSRQGSDAVKEEKKPLPDDFNDGAVPVFSRKSGFVQAVNLGRLIQIAEENDLAFRLEVYPGDFIPWKGELLKALPADHMNKSLPAVIQKTFVIGDDRTTEQDIEFSIEQLSMIAVRALSPGINDPYTAVISIQWLGVMLCRIAECKFLEPYHFDTKRVLRVITRPVLFSSFLDTAFSEIRHSNTSPAVFLCLLDSIGAVARFVKQPENLDSLKQHAENIEFESRQKLTGGDLQKVEDKYRETLKILMAK